MNKPSKFALALAFAAVTASGAASAQSYPEVVDNWRGAFGDVWKNGTNELCWRDAFWTPATGIPGCDGVPVAQAPAPAPVAPTPMANKVVFNADTFFDFDRATLKPEGRQLLDQVVQQVNGINLETIIAVGHTDWTGPETYNQGLSERRAASVKEYLVSQGVDPNRVYTEGKGELEPIADNRTREGRAQNRRVEIEIVGTRR